MKLLGLTIVIGFCLISVSAQTANDLSTKYGAAHESYEVRPGIFTTVKFAADGRACVMWLEKRHLQASGTIDLDPTFLSSGELKSIIEELVPSNERGNETKSSGLTRITGIGGDTLEDYENVSITYIGGVSQCDVGPRLSSFAGRIVVATNNLLSLTGQHNNRWAAIVQKP